MNVEAVALVAITNVLAEKIKTKAKKRFLENGDFVIVDPPVMNLWTRTHGSQLLQ